MPKPNPLTQGLEQNQSPARIVASVPRAANAPKSVAPSRSGRVLIGGHFAPEVQTALRSSPPKSEPPFRRYLQRASIRYLRSATSRKLLKYQQVIYYKLLV